MQDRTGTPRSRRDVLAGALVVALFALFFLRTAILAGDAGVLGPDDCSQDFALTEVDPDARPANPELRRTWATHQTWARMSGERLIAGELPVWNGFNAGGVPHLANPETAVFSPFSWSHYVLPPAAAAWIAAFARLFAAGFATFLFLRELRLAFGAAITGAVVFMFAPGAIATLLAAPTSTVFLLPAGLFLVERIARGVEESIRSTSDRKGLRRASIAFALVIAAALFGGALDTFVFCALVVAAWTVVRLAQVARAARRETAIAIAHLAGVALVSALLCAIQVLPYVEYLREARGATETAFTAGLPRWQLLFFPGLLGGTSGLAWFDTHFAPDFATGAAAAIGALSIVLAVIGFSVAARGATVWFFAVVGLTGLLIGTGAFGFGLLDGLFPQQAEPEAQRALVLFPFAIAVLGAHAVDRAARTESRLAPHVALTAFLVAAAVVLAARESALSLLAGTIGEPRLVVERILAGTAHVELVVATCLVGLGALAFAAVLPRGRLHACLLGLLPLAAYAQLASPLEDFVPVTPARYVLPFTDDVARRDGGVGGRGSLVLGGVDVPPDVNALYGLRSVAVNGPFRILRIDQLKDSLFAPRGEFGSVTHTTRRALELFGIGAVLDADGWVDVDTEFATLPSRAGKRMASAEITSDTPFVQQFTVRRNGPRALRFPWITRGVPNQRVYQITVDDLDTNARLVTFDVTPWAVRPAGRDTVDCIVRFPAGLEVEGHKLLLRVTTGADATAGASYAIGLRTDQEFAQAGWHAAQGGQVLAGQLDLDVSYAHDAFEHQLRVGPFGLYRFTGDVARFRTLGSARVVADDGAAWRAILEPDFAAASEVVLEGAPAEFARRSTAEDEAGARLEVLDELDGHVRLIVKRATPGFVVTPIAWYPGWTARVNSADARPLCANYAFTAVAVPAGESLVELDYAPKSVTKGLILSLAGLLILFVAFATTLPPERRP